MKGVALMKYKNLLWIALLIVCFMLTACNSLKDVRDNGTELTESNDDKPFIYENLDFGIDIEHPALDEYWDLYISSDNVLDVMNVFAINGGNSDVQK
jgi:predicted small secreted protein